MTDELPHWVTIDDEQPVRITHARTAEKNIAHNRTSVPAAKRTPAAFIGIILFLALGFLFFQGMHGVKGQVTSDELEVVITESGIDPLNVSAKAGQKITWKNQSTIPHILSSATLKDAAGKEFETTAIFPQASYSFTLPEHTAAGIYDYISETSSAVMGEITVISTSASAIVQTSAPAAAISSSSIAVAAPVVPVTNSSNSFVPESPEETFVEGGIAQNPYTVGSGNAPLPPRQQGGNATTRAQVTNHMPSSQPQTGMGIWVTFIAGIGAFWLVTRKALKGS